MNRFEHPRILLNKFYIRPFHFQTLSYKENQDEYNVTNLQRKINVTDAALIKNMKNIKINMIVSINL